MSRYPFLQSHIHGMRVNLVVSVKRASHNDLQNKTLILFPSFLNLEKCCGKMWNVHTGSVVHPRSLSLVSLNSHHWDLLLKLALDNKPARSEIPSASQSLTSLHWMSLERYLFTPPLFNNMPLKVMVTWRMVLLSGGQYSEAMRSFNILRGSNNKLDC